MAKHQLSFSLLALACLVPGLEGCAAEKNAAHSPGIRTGDPVDVDGDGVYDGVAVDSDGDGRPDGVDTDADGLPDQRLPGGPPLPDAGMPEPECPETNPFCMDEEEEEEPPIPEGCGEEEFDLTPVGVNVMVAVDASNSMNVFWTTMQEAIRDMINTTPDSNYGVHLFWGIPVESIFEGIAAGFNFCGTTQNDVLEPGPGQQTEILPFMGPQARGQGNQYFDFTPVIDPLNYYLETTTTLEDPKSTNYLVFISDGNDNCFGTAFASRDSKLLAYEKLAIELVKKNIRLLPIGFDASSAQITGANGGMRMTNFDALNTLAKFGGTGLQEALSADDQTELATALQTVAQTVRPCRFSIPATLDPTQNLNPFELNFLLGGKLVQRDRGQREGWDFIAGNTSEVEFYGQACEALRFGTKLRALKGCTSEVCGTAANQVTTKPRAVQYLLDSSLTMTDCSVEGDWACAPKRFCEATFICDPDQAGNLSWWGLMTKSIATSVVDVVNDDVEFGLRMFPSAGADLCTVNDEAEVDPAQGTELSIIRSMLSDLPFGATPIIEGLEKAAAFPGRLVDPEIKGALIVVSDGGEANGCGIEDQNEAVRRAGEATKSLFDRGVKTYVIRFGTRDENTTQDDLVLRAIAENGGTATPDPNDPNKHPYIDAPDEAALNAVLASISDELASCSLELGEVDSMADKDKVNLYLNGEVVPFDAQGEKAEGWGWADAERTEIELYGDSCESFKSNRITSLGVEFGCEPVIIF